jgi:hypothetical protein
MNGLVQSASSVNIYCNLWITVLQITFTPTQPLRKFSCQKLCQHTVTGVTFSFLSKSIFAIFCKISFWSVLKILRKIKWMKNLFKLTIFKCVWYRRPLFATMIHFDRREKKESHRDTSLYSHPLYWILSLSQWDK